MSRAPPPDTCVAMDVGAAPTTTNIEFTRLADWDHMATIILQLQRRFDIAYRNWNIQHMLL